MDYLIYLAFSYLVFSAALLIYILFAGFAGIAYEWTAKIQRLVKAPAIRGDAIHRIDDTLNFDVIS
jgi:hypothetical protein